MSTRFELLCDELGRVSFCLVGNDGKVLLQGLPCRGKIDAQAEIMHTRESLRSPDHLVPHRSQEGEHFVVLKDQEGAVLARSPRVRNENTLRAMVQSICTKGVDAMIVDQTRRRTRG